MVSMDDVGDFFTEGPLAAPSFTLQGQLVRRALGRSGDTRSGLEQAVSGSARQAGRFPVEVASAGVGGFTTGVQEAGEDAAGALFAKPFGSAISAVLALVVVFLVLVATGVFGGGE